MAETAARPRGRRSARASDRLRRLLLVVPFVVQHPGVELAELAERFGTTEGELAEDLNLLFVSGLPPYGPGDLIDVQIEDGRVWIAMADYFGRAVRLTRSEALALYLKGKALMGAPGLEEGRALGPALEKLERALGPETLSGLAAHVEVVGGGHGKRTLAAVRRAVERHESLDIEYYTAARGELTSRRIDPEQVFFEIGNWYVVAWDRLSDAERLFRADRIRSVKETGEAFAKRGLRGAGRPLYSRSERDRPVRLFLGDGARWVAEYYEIERAVPREDGLEVTLPAKDLEWVAKLVLRLGGEAKVLGPPELSGLVRDTAGQTLRLYRRAAPP